MTRGLLWIIVLAIAAVPVVNDVCRPRPDVLCI
jgi:hypothetical protein